VTAPLYLQAPTVEGYTYGRLTYDAKNGYYTIEAEPAVLEYAKRVFPGTGGTRVTSIRFKATRRSVGELNWLMLRFPLKIDAPEFWRDRDVAIDHAHRRDAGTTLAPTAPPATFRGTLFPHQAEGVSFLLHNRRALLADDMGLGKTVTAFAALASANAWPALIVPQPHLVVQWQRMAAAFLALGDEQKALFADGPTKLPRWAHRVRGLKHYALPAVPIHIAHYGILRGWRDVMKEYGYKAIVFDEVQELRHTGTEKYSTASILSGEVEHVWGLSGTPIYGYGAEMWSVMNIIDYHCLGDSDSFTREWCTGYGTKTVRDPVALGNYLRREGLMLRRVKADVQKDLPPKRRVVHVVDKDDTAYNLMIREAIELARGYDAIKGWSERGQTKARIEEMARRATGIAKAPMVAAFVRGLVEAGERVLLFAHHHDVHNLLNAGLEDLGIVKVTGEESTPEKEEAKRKFIAGDVTIIQMALRGAAGVDGLQHRGTVVVFAELDWSPAVHSQCEDRLQRYGFAGMGDSILCYYLVTDTGMDETMQEALGLKIEQFTGMMAEKTETEADREVAKAAAARQMDRVINSLRAKQVA
jgi:SWI/SNF-related matrix-associated actin-dependent regulator 1 of chromatin subfamily A